jgi:ubiquinone/menaquinone biosynthesis C-methylase UbiE
MTLRHIGPGDSTAFGGMLDYRLDKVAGLRRIEGRWLDCGCAEGDYTAELIRRGAGEAVGTDVLAPRVEEARTRWSDVAALSFVVAPAEEMPFADESFDAVLLNEVLEHVEDERRTLREIQRVLVPGGYLFLLSPNRWFPFEGHGAVVGGFVLNFPIPLLPWLPSSLTEPVMRARNWWPGELRSLVEEAGFEVATVDFVLPQFGRYAWLPPFLLRLYEKHSASLEQRRWIRRFGVSTLVAAHKPGPATPVHGPSSPT